MSAPARDDLGWHLIMHPGVTRWAVERNAHSIDTCRVLTLPVDAHVLGPGNTHVGV